MAIHPIEFKDKQEALKVLGLPLSTHLDSEKLSSAIYTQALEVLKTVKRAYPDQGVLDAKLANLRSIISAYDFLSTEMKDNNISSGVEVLLDKCIEAQNQDSKILHSLMIKYYAKFHGALLDLKSTYKQYNLENPGSYSHSVTLYVHKAQLSAEGVGLDTLTRQTFNFNDPTDQTLKNKIEELLDLGPNEFKIRINKGSFDKDPYAFILRDIANSLRYRSYGRNLVEYIEANLNSSMPLGRGYKDGVNSKLLANHEFRLRGSNRAETNNYALFGAIFGAVVATPFLNVWGLFALLSAPVLGGVLGCMYAFVKHQFEYISAKYYVPTLQRLGMHSIGDSMSDLKASSAKSLKAGIENESGWLVKEAYYHPMLFAAGRYFDKSYAYKARGKCVDKDDISEFESSYAAQSEFIRTLRQKLK